VAGVSIGDYLIQRLWDFGVRDVFGIPGDYVLAFYAKLEQSRLKTHGCTSEDCAGFAADAYARVNGIGAVCVVNPPQAPPCQNRSTPFCAICGVPGGCHTSGAS
jgi:hypothetical protein